MKRIVFDIETEPFSEEFKDATTAKARTKHAPKMRVTCIFDESRQEYRYFTPRNAAKLIKLLQSAGEIVSFNGKCFDLLVLRRHYGLIGRVPRRGKHIDLHEIMSEKAGFKVSLDKAVRLNFGERKHTDGRKMEALTLAELKVACRSDVSQTHRLFHRFLAGGLQFPSRTRRAMNEEAAEPDKIPTECPSCLAPNSLEPVECDTQQMSEGQLADNISGMWGTAVCRKCGEIALWGI
ncbi:MAG: ribonuclease H-like domain-containing protein [Terracidiphilus sp.]